MYARVCRRLLLVWLPSGGERCASAACWREPAGGHSGGAPGRMPARCKGSKQRYEHSCICSKTSDSEAGKGTTYSMGS